MALPETMTAVIYRSHGDESVVEVVHDWPTPVRKAGEVLVEQYATSVNRTQLCLHCFRTRFLG